MLGGVMDGYSNDGRRMKITVYQTIFRNTKYIVRGLGENLFGDSGWATVGKFRTFDEALEYAEFKYGFKEADYEM
jgi:hypothetical protein